MKFIVCFVVADTVQYSAETATSLYRRFHDANSVERADLQALIEKSEPGDFTQIGDDIVFVLAAEG